MTVPGAILLDTNVVLHVVRGSEVAARIDAAVQLRSRAERALISVVTVGEALAFARQPWLGRQQDRPA
jgi:tRNA(fMet)-specific endonuclease VapC